MATKKTPKRGDAWSTRNRLYAVVDSRGKLVLHYGIGLAVYATRTFANRSCMKEDGERVVRLGDVAGTYA